MNNNNNHEWFVYSLVVDAQTLQAMHGLGWLMYGKLRVQILLESYGIFSVSVMSSTWTDPRQLIVEDSRRWVSFVTRLQSLSACKTSTQNVQLDMDLSSCKIQIYWVNRKLWCSAPVAAISIRLNRNGSALRSSINSSEKKCTACYPPTPVYSLLVFLPLSLFLLVCWPRPSDPIHNTSY